MVGGTDNLESFVRVHGLFDNQHVILIDSIHSASYALSNFCCPHPKLLTNLIKKFIKMVLN